MSALRGSVRTHAMTMLPATPQRTAERRFEAPTPMMQALMQWVVETGTPRWLAPRMTRAPAASAAKPWMGEMWMIFDPMVLMIFWPPAMVPSAIAEAHTRTTHMGTASPFGAAQCGSTWPDFEYDSSASVMTPIDFCASFEPCANAMSAAETSWSLRDVRFTAETRAFKKWTIHRTPIITKNATMKPSVGETTSGTRTF